MKRPVMGLTLASFMAFAWGGGIIFIDPTQEKAKAQPPQTPSPGRIKQQLEQSLDEARRWRERSERGNILILQEGEKPSEAQERALEAHTYQRGEPPPESNQVIILKQGPPPSPGAKARAEARSWVTSPAADQNRCKIENTVGSIEGQVGGGGSTVIQTTSGGVNVLCK